LNFQVSQGSVSQSHIKTKVAATGPHDWSQFLLAGERRAIAGRHIVSRPSYGLLPILQSGQSVLEHSEHGPFTRARAVYPCTRLVYTADGRGYAMYTAVFTARMHGRSSRVHGLVHGRVHVYTTLIRAIRPFKPPYTGRVHDRVHGRAHGPYMCTWPTTRPCVHYTAVYTGRVHCR